MSYATIFIEETKQGAISDSAGNYSISGICSGRYHIRVSHVGCEPDRFFIDIYRDTTFNIYLDHHQKLLSDVVITERINPMQNQHVVKESFIAENADQNLSTLIETVTGVSSLKTGSGIAKPVIHGLYGNRVSINNNGAFQSGQQWGNDHAPEIDPLAAGKITVVKGSGVVEYPGNSLGGAILVEFPDIPEEPHLHGKINTYFGTNGMEQGANIQAYQKNKILGWRISGTLKNQGDKKTASYFLRNTGSREANIHLKIQKNWSEKIHTEIYGSSFNTIIGILRGSHIGNITDLQEALQREVPFFTEPDFSYQISAPYQAVSHHLLKGKTTFFFSEKAYLGVAYFGQINIRKEYDIRRSGKSSIPALSLNQVSQCIEVKYNKQFAQKLDLKTGFQLLRIDNTNQPETGILPLIPDYLTHKFGFFSLLKKQYLRWQLELGSRYEYENQKVVTITRGISPAIARYNNHFHNFSIIYGAAYRFSPNSTMTANAGLASRSPEINERYSFGLHQGLSSIEEGNPELSSERSFKATISWEKIIQKKFFSELLVYYQNIRQFILLKPQNEFRLTIRGAFPVFRYEQLPVTIWGIDYNASYYINPQLYTSFKCSFVKGYDQVSKNTLVYTPPTNIGAAIAYQAGHFLFLENLGIELSNKYVFKQVGLSPEQDFAPPPPAYNLLGLKITAQKLLKTHNFNFYVKVDNLLNTRYRDYLNRLRYFADDLGINCIVGCSYTF